MCITLQNEQYSADENSLIVEVQTDQLPVIHNQNHNREILKLFCVLARIRHEKITLRIRISNGYIHNMWRLFEIKGIPRASVGLQNAKIPLLLFS